MARADSAMVGMWTAIAAVLAARILLFLSVTGVFVLALLAHDEVGLIRAGGFAVLVVLPLVALDIQARRR